MENPKSYSIDELSRILGVSAETIRMMGKNSVINTHLARHGIDAAVNCEDSRMARQWPGDAEADLARLLGEK